MKERWKVNTRYRQEKSKWKGEKALLVAILDRALRDLGLLNSDIRQRYLAAGVRNESNNLDKQFEDAFEWVFSNKVEPFSFCWIMAELEWDWAVRGIRKLAKEIGQ